MKSREEGRGGGVGRKGIGREGDERAEANMRAFHAGYKHVVSLHNFALI